MHHLLGNSTFITLLSRYGRCQFYRQTLELETATTEQDQQQRSLLPSNISLMGNIVIHYRWDNCDINKETPTHTADSIVIREEHAAESAADSYVAVLKSKIRSIRLKLQRRCRLVTPAVNDAIKRSMQWAGVDYLQSQVQGRLNSSLMNRMVVNNIWQMLASKQVKSWISYTIVEFNNRIWHCSWMSDYICQDFRYTATATYSCDHVKF